MVFNPSCGVEVGRKEWRMEEKEMMASDVNFGPETPVNRGT